MKILLNRKLFELFELFELFDKKVRNYSLFDNFLNPYLNPSLHHAEGLINPKKGWIPHIMLRDLLTQTAWNKKRLLILDTPEHVDSENIKLKIGYGSFLY
jgi:hypothetical protein